MSNVLNPVMKGSVLLLALFLLPSAGLEAACPPGYAVEVDCSARDEHIEDCQNSFDDNLVTIGITAAGCVAACTTTDNEGRCIAACGIAESAAAAAALVRKNRCIRRAPRCERNCVQDSSHPRWWCPRWPDCPYARATPRDPPTPVKAVTARNLAPEVRLRTGPEGSLVAEVATTEAPQPFNLRQVPR